MFGEFMVPDLIPVLFHVVGEGIARLAGRSGVVHQNIDLP
jgi:hypothetical protein